MVIDSQSTNSSLKDVVLQGEPLKQEAAAGSVGILKTADMSSSSRLVRLLGCDVAARACRSVDFESKSPTARPLANALRAHSAHG